MGRFRAILLGIAEYDDPAIRALPFVSDDLINVALALESRGYEIEIPGGSRLGRTQVMTEVDSFLNRARPGDTLLIYLSGHGIHADNADYLVPSDANQSWPRLAEVCVPLSTWGSTIENSKASGIVFLVDACREGFQENVKSVVSRTAWDQDKLAAARRRNAAWMFPCAPGEVARFVSGSTRENGNFQPFSLFSRAVERAIIALSEPGTLAKFTSSVIEHMTVLADEFHMPHQQVRVAGEADHNAFIILPQRSVVADSTSGSWSSLVTGHIAWQLAEKRAGDSELQDAAIRFVQQLEHVRDEAFSKLAPDPWQEPSFALRMTERMQFLLGSLLSEIKLSHAEAALLVTTPFIHAAHWGRLCAQASVVDPGDLRIRHEAGTARADFEKYAQRYPRLLRRAAGYRDSAERVSAEIGWWLLHRWVSRQPTAFSPQTISELLTAVPQTSLFAETFTATRTSELVRALRTTYGLSSRGDGRRGLSPVVTLRAGCMDEQHVRERMVGYLLVVAHRLAIETAELSDIVADHLGVADPIMPRELLVAIESARWEPRGNSRVLRAACPHPAAEVALREHVVALDAILADLRNSNDPDLAVLSGIPGHAGSDGVRAAETAGAPAYTSAGIRFHLDEQRIQELLMGRQLYGDSDLAIREMYQNALDACRYRRARIEYLRRAGGEHEWEGKIRLRQGIDDNGRMYIECEDNGIGMGLHELQDVFAQAGARFAELPEFIEEKARWELLEPPVKIYPNSRFGIGVLSYFMLADEISVTTCRLNQNGDLGRRLQVSIAGPGTLFRIIDLGQGVEAGTTVRLYLRPTRNEGPVSCVDILRRLLWISEFLVEVTDGSDWQAWPPGELIPPYYRNPRGLFPVDGLSVWWCDDDGAILVDGLKTDDTFFGAVVNLTGEDSPHLAVDRKNLLDSPYNRRILTRVLSKAVEPFASSKGPILSFDWLYEFTDQQPATADLIFDTAISAGARILEINGRQVDIARLGFFAPDRDLIPASSRYRRPEYSRDAEATRMRLRGIEPLTDHLMRWRLCALNAGKLLEQDLVECNEPKLVQARPSDWVIVRPDPRDDSYPTREMWLGSTEDQPMSVRRVIAAAERLDCSIGYVAGRLIKLGFEVSSTLCEIGSTEPYDLIILNKYLNPNSLTEKRSWLPEDQPIPSGHVVAAAVQTAMPVNVIARRLDQLGFQVASVLLAVGDAEPVDRLIVSRDLDGQPPWLRCQDNNGCPIPVPIGHVVAAAAQTTKSVGHVAQRLTNLGFKVPTELFDADFVQPEDVPFISFSIDGEPPMISGTRPVPPGHLIAAAETLDLPIHEIMRKLVELGFEVPEIARELEDTDCIILSWDLDGDSPWLNPTNFVSTHHIIASAAKIGKGVGYTAKRIASFGLKVPGPLLAVNTSESSDLIIISHNLTAEEPWLVQWDDNDVPIAVPTGHIAAAAEKIGKTIGEVAQRFAALGYQVQPSLFKVGKVEPNDVVISSRDLTGEAPWITRQIVPLGHILAAAEQLNRPARNIATRLTALGFETPTIPSETFPSDIMITSWELSGLDQQKARDRRFSKHEFWHSHESPIPMWHLVAGAAKMEVAITDLSERVLDLGFQLPDTRLSG